MSDLDKLIKLKLELSTYSGYEYDFRIKYNEYQSLYEKLKKAEEDAKHLEELQTILECEDVWYDILNLVGTLKRDQKSQEDIEKIKKYDSICDSSATQYMVKLEKEIQQLKEEDKLLRERINTDRIIIERLEQDSKTNAEIVEKIKELANNPCYADYGSQSFYYIQPDELQSILKDNKA